MRVYQNHMQLARARKAIYISEFLTKENAYLFYVARQNGGGEGSAHCETMDLASQNTECAWHPGQIVKWVTDFYLNGTAPTCSCWSCSAAKWPYGSLMLLLVTENWQSIRQNCASVIGTFWNGAFSFTRACLPKRHISIEGTTFARVKLQIVGKPEVWGMYILCGHVPNLSISLYCLWYLRKMLTSLLFRVCKPNWPSRPLIGWFWPRSRLANQRARHVRRNRSTTQM